MILRPTQSVRTLVVDDHVFMRELIGSRLSRQKSRYTVVGQAGDVAGARDACEKLHPDLLILDINLPDQSGIAAVPELKRVSPSTSILLCTAFAGDDVLTEAMDSGAEGFVEKTNTWDSFIDAVDCISRGGRYFRASSPNRKVTNTSRDERMETTADVHLSRREHEVLALLAQGSTSKEIAGKLFISVTTVDTHRAKLLTKLKARNVAGLVLYAVRHGLVELPAARLR